MKPIALALLFLGLATAASAQAPNPIVEHYRAYRAALERNDLPAAETEAVSALEASEARDGDGGRTAVLAYNLATVRFLQSDFDGALTPARRALELAELRGGAASGVSPILARLVVGRAELAADEGGAVERVRSALAEAQAERLAAEEIFDAADQLGMYAFTHADYGLAREAWSIAANYAEGARIPGAFSYARARTGEGAARLMEELTSRGYRRRNELNEEVSADSYGAFSEALALLRPLAVQEAASGGITLAQAAYAEAVAWRAALRAKVRTDGQRLPELPGEAEGDADGFSEIEGAPGVAERPRCLLTLHAVPRIIFPQAAMDDYAIGGVALRIRVNEAGEIVEAASVAAIGRPEFSRAVDRVAGRWTVTRREDSPPNCRMAATLIYGVSFMLR